MGSGASKASARDAIPLEAPKEEAPAAYVVCDIGGPFSAPDSAALSASAVRLEPRVHWHVTCAGIERAGSIRPLIETDEAYACFRLVQEATACIDGLGGAAACVLDLSGRMHAWHQGSPSQQWFLTPPLLPPPLSSPAQSPSVSTSGVLVLPAMPLSAPASPRGLTPLKPLSPGTLAATKMISSTSPVKVIAVLRPLLPFEVQAHCKDIVQVTPPGETL
jgi:hypothetical protein